MSISSLQYADLLHLVQGNPELADKIRTLRLGLEADDLLEHFKYDAMIDQNCTTHTEYERNDSHAIRIVRRKWYRRPDPLGWGIYGKVWLESDEADTHLRAVKVVQKNMMERDSIDYKREILALAKFSKPQYQQQEVLVSFLGWLEDPSNLYLYMEFFPLGDLESHISESIPEEEVKDITTNLLNGLRIIHAEQFTHRDLKPGNIFVARKPPVARWWVKIGDFGIAKRVNHERTALYTSIGTPKYTAPEVSGDLDTDEPTSIYDNAADMWSLGCVIFRIATQQDPFPTRRDVRRFCDGRAPFPDEPLRGKMGLDGVKFVKALISPLPTERITAEAALGMAWIQNHNRNTLVATDDEWVDGSSHMPTPGRSTSSIDFNKAPKDQIATTSDEFHSLLGHPSSGTEKVPSTPKGGLTIRSGKTQAQSIRRRPEVPEARTAEPTLPSSRSPFSLSHTDPPRHTILSSSDKVPSQQHHSKPDSASAQALRPSPAVFEEHKAKQSQAAGQARNPQQDDRSEAAGASSEIVSFQGHSGTLRDGKVTSTRRPGRRQRYPAKQSSQSEIPEPILSGVEGHTSVFKAHVVPENHTLNIIAIHGMENTADGAWTHIDGGVEVNWLTHPDMLPKALPTASIYTFEWRMPFGSGIISGVLRRRGFELRHKWQEALTRTPKPTVVIACDFGGLVLASALAQAEGRRDAQAWLLDSLRGLVFLGTPFRGADDDGLKRWEAYHSHIVQLCQAKSDLSALDWLSRGRLINILSIVHTPFLQEICQGLERAITNHNRTIPTVCYYEIHDTKFKRSPLTFKRPAKPGVLVESTDAWPGITSVHHAGLPTDHRGLNKFAGPHDPSYRKLRDQILAFVGDTVPRTLPSEWDYDDVHVEEYATR
ncbi:kinase-like protein [Aspergillus brunneoviolaceus CBS 621.78]|uniref:Kinase-like protein n=1 Tax=Aspergillus brunneoviolaceus CBS 621.78 TaxID=1450534 RepID=A0ACD1G1S4_9EURO|nr:kinase-like protein [Aspergillus brunneoviolaceus CBS 621.78]RAH43214.1 kinase-like protein [Aspergillus brunneoviolaceus CBS 621.78]